MRGHFRYLRFKTFPMTPRTPQCNVFWALLLNSKHSGVLEDSKSPTLEVLGFTPTLGQSGVATQMTSCEVDWTTMYLAFIVLVVVHVYLWLPQAIGLPFSTNTYLDHDCNHPCQQHNLHHNKQSINCWKKVKHYRFMHKVIDQTIFSSILWCAWQWQHEKHSLFQKKLLNDS
jgi:hypothetical protein